MKDRFSTAPLNYKILLDVDLKNFTYTGKESILVDIKSKTNKIVLNSVDLTISRCVIIQEGKSFSPKISFSKNDEEITLAMKEKISGSAELQIEFTGKLTDNLAGFYRSKYDESGKEKFLATTQFEPVDARRAFPCFDHPAMKATFDISFIIDEELEGISNMPVATQTKLPEGRKLVVFQTTPLMSTYLVYFGVGNFEFLEGKYGKVQIRVATVPGRSRNGAFAIECTQKFLKYFEDYFGVHYPLAKIDLIAIPDFASGAMENWGAITFREIELLFDEKAGSTARKQRVAEIVAHELAHQWFGNLVTMQWWNDLWLNESFASWISYKIVDHFFPQWDIKSHFLNDMVVGAFSLDSLRTTHPIEVKVTKPHELNEIFDAISYNKGASIIHMLERYLGEAKFKEGLRIYMSKHRYGNTVTYDLWDALGKASGINVKGITDGWIKQSGYPTVSVKQSGGKIKLSQKRFFFDEPQKEDTTLWKIPIIVKHDNGKTVSFLMEKASINFEPHSSRFKLNPDQDGFYHVHYDKELLQKVKGLILENKVSNIDKWQVQNDLYSLVIKGDILFEDYVDFIESYSNERDFLVCSDILHNLYFAYHIGYGQLKEIAMKATLNFARDIFGWLGWDTKKGEDENYAQLRTNIIVILSELGEDSIVEEANKRFEKFLQTGELEPNLRGAVINSVARKGTKATFDLFVKKFKESEALEDQRRYLFALGSFKDPKLLKKTLEFSLSKNVRIQDAYIPLISVSSGSDGKALAWPFLRDNWKKLEKTYGKGGSSKMLGTFLSVIPVSSGITKEREVKQFFSKHDTKTIKQSLARTLESLRINYNFLKANRGLP